MKIKRIWQELKRRNVLKIASIYAIAGWLIIQVAATTFPFLGLPAWTVTATIIIVLMGFPAALILSWIYDIVPEKETETKLPDAKAEGETSFPSSKTTKQFWVSISLLILIITAGTIWFFSKKHNFQSAYQAIFPSDRIAVLAFENLTGDTQFDVLGKMASDWICQGLQATGEVKIVSLRTLKDKVVKAEFSAFSQPEISFLKNKIGATNVIDGAFYLNGDSLWFSANLYDLTTGDMLTSFSPQPSSKHDPLQAIDLLKQRISGFWTTKDKPSYRLSPPLYDAYKEYLAAQDIWNSDYEKALFHLDKAMALDSTFLPARFLKMVLLINLGEYEAVAKFQEQLDKKRGQLNPFQINLLNFFSSVLKGNNLAAYNFYRKEYEQEPFDLFANTGMAVLALEYANKPKEAIEIVTKIDPDSLDFESCYYCLTRVQILAIAYVALRDFKKALATLDKVAFPSQDRATLEIKVQTLARSGQLAALRQLLKNSREASLNRDFRYLYYLSAREFKLLEKEDFKKEFAEQASALYRDTTLRKNSNMLARSFYLQGLFDEAEAIFKKRYTQRPTRYFSLIQLGTIYAQRNEKNKALQVVEKLNALKIPYSFGYIPYHQARICALLGEKEKALDFLKLAIQKGKKFDFISFDNDPDFLNLFDLPEYKKLVGS